MNTNHRKFLSLMGSTIALLVLSCCGAIAQTNVTDTSTNLIIRLPAPTDFQRLQYYYASSDSSPAPGTEQGIFTVGNDRSWNGDWNSTAVPMPSRTQLNAVTPAQIDLFNRAGVYTNGSWQIVTSQTNIPLSALTVTSSMYMQIRATAGRDKQIATYQRIQAQTTQSQSISP